MNQTRKDPNRPKLGYALSLCLLSLCLLSLCLLSLTASPLFADETDNAQAARDEVLIQTLMRLENVDVNGTPRLKEIVLRYLQRVKGQPQYVELVKRFDITGVGDELARLAVSFPQDTLGVDAAQVLLQQGQLDQLRQGLQGKDEELALKVIQVLGHVANDAAEQLLRPVVTDGKLSTARRAGAVTGVGRTRNGQRWLLDQVAAGKIPAALHFSAADVLLHSDDAAIQTEAAKYLQLPASADAQPLPPLSELARRRGDPGRGRELFVGKATCSKCHRVQEEGKDVGPDLSGIGNKLSREAMYVSILDPNSGISHNYETYAVVLASGNVATGILVSQTDDSVTIKTAEAIVKEFPRDEIDELIKQKVSLMPSGLQKLISAEELVDIVEYLTTLKKAQPTDELSGSAVKQCAVKQLAGLLAHLT